MKMTNQQILDKVYETFIVNKTPRCMAAETTTCMYNGESIGDPDHPGCAVGCLLPKELTKRMDAMGRGKLVNFFLSPKYFANEYWLKSHADVFRDVSAELGCEDIESRVKFLTALQTWHDYNLSEDKRYTAESRLREIAKKWDLTIKEN